MTTWTIVTSDLDIMVNPTLWATDPEFRCMTYEV